MGPGFESQRDHLSKKQAIWPAFLIFIPSTFSDMAWVYILFSKKINKYYVGACKELDRRLYEHNIGRSKFTSTGMPWELVFSEKHGDLVVAKRRELEIKKKKSRIYIESLIRDNGKT